MDSQNFEVEIKQYGPEDHAPLMFRMALAEGTLTDEVTEQVFKFSVSIEVGGRDFNVEIEDNHFHVDLKPLIYHCVEMYKNGHSILSD